MDSVVLELAGARRARRDGQVQSVGRRARAAQVHRHAHQLVRAHEPPPLQGTSPVDAFFIYFSNLFNLLQCDTAANSHSLADTAQALQTLYYVLMTLVRLMAPITPFLCDNMYMTHLCNFNN